MSTPGEGGRVGTSPAGGGTAGRPAARPRRRGGGPEASSATATIVAVTISDSAAPAVQTREITTRAQGLFFLMQAS